MSAHGKVDPSTLGWVKSEIDETLKQARLALESFSENPTDKTRLRFCVTHLHQVVGTLLMVELDGAALIARETEALAEAVLDDNVAVSEPVIETLTHGLLILPDYLALLQIDQPDVPLRYLPLLNEMRAARRAAPLAALDMFAPDLSVRPPADRAAQKPTDDEYRAMARQRRAAYQTALLEWLRDTNNTGALERLGGLLEDLQTGSAFVPVEQLFWVGAGLVEGLRDGGLEPTADRKKLFARLDQQIKKLFDGADRSVLRKTSEELTRSMLLEIGGATSQGPRIAQLRQAFELDRLIGAPSAVPAEAYELPSPEVLKSVADALGKEIETAQDLLSTYFDPEHPDPAVLDRLLELLHRMSGTLEMLGAPALKGLVDVIIDVGRAIKEGRLADSQRAAMPMAQALILVEHSTRDFPRSAGEWRARLENAIDRLRVLVVAEEPGAVPGAEGIEVSDAELTDTEFKQLLGVVGAEINVNLARIEELLEAFAADTNRTEQLDDVPGLLSQIQGALQIIGQERAAELIDAAHLHVDEIRHGSLLADSAIMDALAVCVGTIGAYVEGLRTGRRNLDNLVDSAIADMETSMSQARRGVANPTALVADVQHHVDTWLRDPADRTAYNELSRSLREVAALAGDDPALARMARLGGEMGNLLKLVSQDPSQLGGDVRTMLEQSRDALAALAGRAPTPAPQAAPEPIPLPSVAAQVARSSAPRVMVSPDADPEIVEIFIEDARDVLKNVRREFGVWRTDPENVGALTELRRGYHTIKGSGRMVGASVISEFSWAVENMLNKLRDGKIEFQPEMVTLLERVQQAMAELVDELAGGAAHTADVETLTAQAEAFAKGEPVSAGAAPEPPPPSRPAPVVETAPEFELPKLDGTLLEIFTGEARGHLTTFGQEIAACRHAGSVCLVTQPLFRATHTLAGNARSLGLQFMADACAEAEKLMNALRTHELPLESAHVDLLDRLRGTIDELIGALNGSAANNGDIARRFTDLAKTFHAASAHLIEPEAAVPAHAPAAAPRAEPAPVKKVTAPEPVKAPPPPPEPPRVVEPAPRPTPRAAAPAEPVSEQIDPELVEIFQEEAVDILGGVDGALAHWRGRPTDLSPVPELMRSLHTLKGGARMAGAMTMGALAHNTESLLKGVEEHKVAPGPHLLDVLNEVHDTLVDMLDRIREGKPVAAAHDLNQRIQELISGAPAAIPAPAPVPMPPAAVTAPIEPPAAAPSAGVATAPPVRTEAPVATRLPEPEVVEPASVPAVVDALPENSIPLRDVPDERREEEAEEAPGAWPEKLERRGQIRVNTNLLNNLVNYAGEVSIARSRMEQQIYGFRDNLLELSRNVTRFRDQLRELEIQSESQILYRAENFGEAGKSADFDPLEFDRFSRLQQLSRGLSESLHDLTTIQGNLGNFIGVAETVLQQQARINTELQEGLMRTRMVNFSTQAARLRHIVRQTARELGKRVELDLTGADVEVDRNVLERMIGPFEHMIRNSIDHGIESEAVREKLGKPATGRITIATAQEGSEIVIRVSDDGGGLNTEAIRRKAVERGLATRDAQLTDDELVQFILMSGFSTAEKVTSVSGRGVGMDVVHNEVKQLGGAMSVNSKRNVGTTFVIRLPLTLSITQALMVYVGDQQYAVPLGAVANIVEFPVERLNEIAVGKNPLLSWHDHVYPYMHLGQRFGVETVLPRNGRKVPVLIARAGNREVAMQVDALGGTREVVIKTLGPQLTEIKGLAGATILGDGRVVLILDIPGLWYRDDTVHVEHEAVPAAEPEPKKHERPVIMVVDDSLTVRKVTSKHLQKRGMEVMVAKDGVEAVEQLRERLPDVMLVDIEMPRMDGYELTSRVRGDRLTKHIPIIMITSRAGAKHRQKAFDLGVDIYMSKPYQEEDLFANIDKMLAEGHQPARQS